MAPAMDTRKGLARFEHEVFVITLLGKGLLGLMQIIAAVAIVLGVTDQMPAIARWLVSAELAEDPGDFVASRLIALADGLPGSDTSFYAVYFAAHGALHLGIMAALLIGVWWAYPVGIVVLGAFVIYQMADWVAGGGTMLLFLTGIDLLVIFLTVQEWRRKRHAA